MMRSSTLVATALAAIAAISLLVAGCRDELTAPTRGFIAIDTVDGAGFELEEVQVFIDGEFLGIDVAITEDLPEGEYLVAVYRDGFESTPAEGQSVRVRAGETAVARFTLFAFEFGSVSVSATDELFLTSVEGAEVLLREGSDFVSTGQVTPAVIDDIRVGNTEVLVRSPDHADAVQMVTIVKDETATASVELGPTRKVLAEMFTYQTCPNCPESAEELKAIRADHPDQFFVIEWHSLEHAAFILYDPRWRAREWAYTGGIRIGYPGVVVQGGYADDPRMLDGSRPTELVQYRQRTDNYLAECDSDCDDPADCRECEFALVVDGTISPTSADLVARLKWREGVGRTALNLRFVLLESAVNAPGIGAPYYFVPRNYHEEAVSFTSPGEILEIQTSLSVDPSWDVSHLEYVAYLQSDATLEILAVDGTH